MAKCMYPYAVERSVFHTQGDRYIPVPCGKCPECLKRRTASWTHRLEKESLLWEKTFFLTFTYSNDHLPLSGNNLPTLDPSHVTLWLKRVRKLSGAKLRYYYCGEYGTKFERPHYHMILFADHYVTEKMITDQWYYGQVHFGKVEGASIRYTVQYMDKGQWRPSHQRDDRVPEFSRMSNGIGSHFLSEKMVNHFLSNPGIGYIYDTEGKKISIPRYYKKRLYDQSMTDTLVANHPSVLVHRDDMYSAREVHHEKVKEYIDSQPIIEETQQRNEDRKAAILNYRKSKRKTRQ